MRKTLTLALYLGFVELLSYLLVVVPAYSFQVSSSTTGYVRVASQAAMASMVAAQRAATLASVAPLISGASAGSVAVRLVAGSVGWPALGIVAGLTLAMLYYDATKVAAMKSAAAGPTPYSIPGFTLPQGATVTKCTAVGGPCPFASTDFSVLLPPVPPATSCGVGMYTVPTGWSGLYSYGNNCQMIHASGDVNAPVPGTVTPATPAQVTTYIGGLPANNPNSIESNTVPVGSQGAPIPADSTASNPVPDTGLATTVVPATSVQNTDTVVNPNATPPAGTETTKENTQPTTGTTTTTTTTTTNPDGSVTKSETKTEQDTASVSCATGNHDQRTFGSILQEHMNRWAGSGLLSALNLLKTLTWPTAIPTYSLQSSLLGNFTLDFSAWSGMLTAIRAIVIAIAGFVAYKIIFVGAR